MYYIFVQMECYENFEEVIFHHRLYLDTNFM